MIWLMTRGELPDPRQARLLDIALMSAVDHGPQAPSIAIARMAATCGVGLNNAMATAVNVLGDVHGGAGEQAVELYESIITRIEAGADEAAATDSGARRVRRGSTARSSLASATASTRSIRARSRCSRWSTRPPAQASYPASTRASRARSRPRSMRQKGRRIPMNIDGATAVIYAELGFPAPLARGLFCLSRSVGILAHAWEQTQQGGRNKGPIPRKYVPAYDGPAPRPVPISADSSGQ